MGAVKIDATEHLGLVWGVARKWQVRCNLPIDDLVQEGSIGLLRAVEKFDPDRGVAFSTYAVWWINAYISRYLENCVQHIRIPNRIHQKLSKARALPPHPTSLDKKIALDGGAECSLHDFVADGTLPDPETASATEEEAAIVWREVERLPNRAGFVLRRRFVDGATLQEVGDELELSRERVRQIEVQALKTLRSRLEAALS